MKNHLRPFRPRQFHLCGLLPPPKVNSLLAGRLRTAAFRHHLYPNFVQHHSQAIDLLSRCDRTGERLPALVGDPSEFPQNKQSTAPQTGFCRRGT
jgi:hypothetical protein